jgi:hypothetical protein
MFIGLGLVIQELVEGKFASVFKNVQNGDRFKNGTPRNDEEIPAIGLGKSTGTFGDVKGYAQGSSKQLIGDGFIQGAGIEECGHLHMEVFCFNIDVQFVKIEHRR